MRTLNRNKVPFWYALYVGSKMLTDENGNMTGEKKLLYSEPVEMFANVSPATGNSTAEQFGGLDNYDKVIVTDDVNCPIDEQTILFVDCKPERSADGSFLYDYIVRRVAKSLNSVSIAISRVSVS